MLSAYAEQHGFQNTEFYVDDGYSGTNFDRPSWNRLISDVKNQKVETVICKDMSRIRRDYLQVGIHTEVIFPEMDVHFIAINDNVDSEHGDDDFTPFRNILN